MRHRFRHVVVGDRHLAALDHQQLVRQHQKDH
jgi:hypothetical protein